MTFANALSGPTWRASRSARLRRATASAFPRSPNGLRATERAAAWRRNRMGGRRRHVLEPHRALVRALVGETPHLTIDRLRDLLAAQGIAGVPGHDLAVPQARGAAL